MNRPVDEVLIIDMGAMCVNGFVLLRVFGSSHAYRRQPMRGKANSMRVAGL